MNQLGDALEAAGFTPDEVTKLRSFPMLGELKKVLRGLANIVVVKHIIDCDADPFVPEGWSVESHKKIGNLEWDPTKVKLHLSLNQQNGKCIEGNKLRAELASEPVLNANVLDHLLAHPELIPEEWKGKAIFFWGTIYRCSDGRLCVRYLYWRDGRWYCDRWLGLDFCDYFPAACSQVS
jgi:hypothetical protein